jgi:hypothetical protein
MPKFSEADRRRIMAEARANIARPVDDYVPPEHDEPSKLDEWRAWHAEREREERRAAQRPRPLTDSERAMLRNELVAMIEEAKTFILAVLAESLGEFGSELADLVEAKMDGALAAMTKMADTRFSEMQRIIAELRARPPDGKSEHGTGEVIDLPNPLPLRRAN